MFRSKKRQLPKTASIGGGPVGTEAAALQSIEWNAQHFKYPSNGFYSRIEHSLLYSMIRESTIFPSDVVVQTIEEEDFSVYLFARPEKKSVSTDVKVSYSQLSAILALVGESWPSESDVPQTLCKHVLKCVIRYAEKHELDRKTETDELLQPLLDHARSKENQEAVNVLAPFYVGWAASMLTGNPLPMLAMYTVTSVANIKMATEDIDGKRNMQSMVQSTERAADIEQASLLDECEHTDEYDEDYN